MTFSTWTIVKWTLAVGAFLGVMGTAGCSLFSPARPQADAIAPANAPSNGDGGAGNGGGYGINGGTNAGANGGMISGASGQPEGPAFASADAESAQPKPPAVNVFGEFDGVETGSAAGAGAAGFQQHTFLDEGYDSDVSCDPTGKTLIFASTRHSMHPNIYTQRVDGLSVTQLTNDDSDHANPVFSPDGTHIAFASTRSGNWNIYVMDTEGRNVTQVTSGTSQDLHPSFSPDGTRLVYCSLAGRGGQWELWTVDLNTGEKRMIGYGLFPQWSPARDGDHIAFQRARQRGSRWFSLWTLDLIEGEARHVTEVAVSANAAIVSPTWSPDGRNLAFATIVEPAKTDGVKPVGQQDIWTIAADGTDRHRLTDGNGRNLSPYWAPDNRIFFISDRGGCECVWSVKTESPKPLTASATNVPTQPGNGAGSMPGATGVGSTTGGFAGSGPATGKPATPATPARQADAVGQTDPGND
jgi:hypothetical protein